MERTNEALYQLVDSLRGQDEEELREVLELLFFAYRDFTGEADAVLARAHAALRGQTPRAVSCLDGPLLARPALTLGLPPAGPARPRSARCRRSEAACSSSKTGNARPKAAACGKTGLTRRY